MRGTMYRAEVEPMSRDADLIPRMGLYKVLIYEGERFVRSDQENMAYWQKQRGIFTLPTGCVHSQCAV
jgi:hypothetical protein